ncbi:dopamine beta-hydroxylase-like [Littorina saxatilis]|uniref:dopamine beta-hydroxylase-like n=1 Tax=Littorina saxatilis TaxID=31220 RepID=UPI0038B47DF0
MRTSLLTACCLVQLLARPALAFYYYQTRLPNGQQVPHPCKANYIWHGVGHRSPTGGGARNPFGQHFETHGHKWTAELCWLDSDGDGLTNGEELGDPQCEWREGQLPRRTDNITHPGVCDPWGSDRCNSNNSWVSCEDTSFKCDAINEPEVRNLTMRIPRTKVPAEDTTYMCHVFELPDDQEYHIIANTPVIDNHNVMHHMGIMECFDAAELTDSPVKCGMNLKGCGSLIGIWTLGMSGQCLHSNAGFKFGKNGMRKVALQYHWTNKNHVTSWDDASGMTIYYTPKLRPYNAGMAIFGQEFLEIPPGRPSVTAVGSCSADCTRRYMDSPIYITSALNHMHYLGVQGRTELFRDGRKVQDIAHDGPYGYDNPHLHLFSDPVAFGPGDEMRVTCQYSTLSKPVTTMWGEGSFDEMCYTILSYYPKETLRKDCNQWKNLDKCSIPDDGCDYLHFFDTSRPDIKTLFDEVLAHCNPYGSCRQECPAAVEAARNASRCMLAPYWEYMKNRLITRPYSDPLVFKFVAAVDLCDAHSSNVTTPQAPACPQKPSTPATSTPATSTPPTGGSALGIFSQLLRQLGDRPLLQNIIINDNRN